MAIRRSTALVNAMAQGYGMRELLKGGRLYLYSGSQPATADLTVSGTNLVLFTANGGTYTQPTRSFATVAIGGSATGTLATLKVGGMAFDLLSAPVSYTSSAAATCDLIVANINARQNPLNIVASRSGDNVLLHLPYWIGALGDSLTFAATVTGSLTATASGVFGGGVTTVNGLDYLETITAGAIAKDTSSWQGTGLVGGTAGYFRYVAAGSTHDGVSGTDIRFDGAIGTAAGAGIDMVIGNLTIVAGTIYNISNGSITEPTV